MLPGKFATPLIIERQPSKYLFCFLITLHLLALLALALIEIPSWFKSLAVVLVLLSAFVSVYSISNTAAFFVSRLIWSEHDWRLFDRKQGEHYSVLSKNWCIHPFFIILEFMSDSGSKNRVFLSKDSIDKDVFRMLSIRLRHTQAESEA